VITAFSSFWSFSEFPTIAIPAAGVDRRQKQQHKLKEQNKRRKTIKQNFGFESLFISPPFLCRFSPYSLLSQPKGCRL